MAFRAAFAALIAVVLLSASCLASACETSCNLKAIGTGCHHASTAVSTAKMSSMHDCGMQLTDATDQSLICSTLAASSCKYLMCGQPLQSLTSDHESIAADIATAQPALIASVLKTPTPLKHRGGEASTPPLTRTPLLASLQTLLRV